MKRSMTQKNEALWSLFERTGSIVFYLLYRAAVQPLAKRQVPKSSNSSPLEQQS